MAKDTPQARKSKTEPKVKRPVLSKYEAGVKVCLQCAMYVYNGVRICHGCGFEFYPKKEKGMRYADTKYGKERRPTK